MVEDKPILESMEINAILLSLLFSQFVSYYRLQHLKFGEATYVNIDTAITATIYRVTELLPYTGYMFRVQAVNDLGGGDYSIPTQVILTAESGRF